MSNFGFGFNRGQFGGGMRFPFGGGAAGQGGFQPRPFQGGMQIQQRPGFPGLQSSYRTLLHRPNQPPTQQIQQAARPMVPPATRGAGGSFGAGAAIQGDVNGAGRLARPLMDNPAAFGGFLSVPPEPTRPTMPPNQFASNHPASSTASIFTQAGMMNPSQARQWSPQEQATMDRFSADQAMNRLQDANPNFRDNLAGSMERDRGIIEKGMVPDVNDPNFQGITPQQAFQQIPGNPFNVMGNRFSAIEANRSPNVQGQSAMDGMTASQTTTTMPKYSDRYAAAEQQNSKTEGYVPVDANGPAYRLNEAGAVVPRGSITPMPRAGGQLTPEEFRRMQAVGSSVGEWMKKSQWMADKKMSGVMTPDQAQAYTAEQQQKRLAQNDMIHQNKMKRIGQAEQIREAKSRQAGQLFQRNNPGLFSDMNLTAAQLAYGLAGGDLRQFQQAGVTPAQALSAQLQNNSNQANLIAQMPEGEAKDRAIEAYQRGQLFGGSGLGSAGGGLGDAGAADGYNRNDAGELDRGRIAGKIEQVLQNPNATADDLIRQGINNYTLAELEQNLGGRLWGDDPKAAALKELIRQAREKLRQQRPNQPPSGQPPMGQVPNSPPTAPPSGLGSEPVTPWQVVPIGAY